MVASAIGHNYLQEIVTTFDYVVIRNVAKLRENYSQRFGYNYSQKIH